MYIWRVQQAKATADHKTKAAGIHHEDEMDRTFKQCRKVFK